jgi:hypothetical protein
LERTYLNRNIIYSYHIFPVYPMNNPQSEPFNSYSRRAEIGIKRDREQYH